MGFQTLAHSYPLQNQTHINQLIEIFRHFIIQSHSLLDEEITDSGFLMSIHHLRFQCIIFRWGKSSNRLHFRKCLKTKLTHKTRNFRIQTFKRFLTIPDTPIMAVCNLPTFGTSPIGLVRRTMHIETMRIKFSYFTRQQLTEKFVIALLHSFHNTGISVFLIPSPVAHTFINFIVSTPHSQTGMVP